MLIVKDHCEQCGEFLIEDKCYLQLLFPHSEEMSSMVLEELLSLKPWPVSERMRHLPKFDYTVPSIIHSIALGFAKARYRQARA